MKILLCFFILSTTAITSWAFEIVVINQPVSKKDKRSEYSNELLKQVFIKTEDQYSPITIKITPVKNKERAKTLMYKENSGDVINAATRKDWEKDLIPIKIPILKGLMGMRVLFINQNRQPQFTHIHTLEKLKELPLGSGHVWAITETFKQAGFLVVTSAKYESLFKMLEKGRFDYFPRGVNEVLDEYKLRKGEYPQLHIEETILFKLPLPVYFFVNPNKPELAKRIEIGLSKMIKDGSFDEMYNKYYEHDLKKLKIEQRKIFEINDNMLTPTLLLPF